MKHPVESVNLPALVEACGKFVEQLGDLAARLDTHPMGAAVLLGLTAIGFATVTMLVLAIICLGKRLR